MLSIASALDSYCPIVVRLTGRAPGTILLLDIHCNSPIISDSIIGRGLTRCRRKNITECFYRQLSDDTMDRNRVDGMISWTSLIWTDFGV